ncbi:MAG TPA: HAD family phosphatase [Candidatus Hydrogenedentes bacterium]|nr:HAD family phosphatase [Candidatus Hydrogenedentota bacterium]
MVKAFLFDLDGTLLDSEILWVESLEMYMSGKNSPITHEEALEIVYGVSWENIFFEVARRYPGIAAHLDDMYSGLQRCFIQLRDSRDVRIPGSIECLKRLSQDYPVAIVSGSFVQDIAHGVEIMGIGAHIRFYLGGEHYSPGKPDPACYLLAAKKLGLPPSECLAFEDSTMGIQAAKEAGMHCVALARKGRPAQEISRADLVLEDLALFSPHDYERTLAAAVKGIPHGH